VFKTRTNVRVHGPGAVSGGKRTILPWETEEFQPTGDIPKNLRKRIPFNEMGIRKGTVETRWRGKPGKSQGKKGENTAFSADKRERFFRRQLESRIRWEELWGGKHQRWQ